MQKTIKNILLFSLFFTFSTSIYAIEDDGPDKQVLNSIANKFSGLKLEVLYQKNEVKRLATCGDFDIKEEKQPYFYEMYKILSEQENLLVLVDKNNNIGPNYRPAKLETVNTDFKMTPEAAQALNDMMQEAKKDGIKIYPVSAYRSYNYQDGLFNRRAGQTGEEYAKRYIAQAGASQHQLGTAVDINSTEINFENTKEFEWLSKNAGRFGFSLSFPKDAQDITGYAYEPWHYRYIGKIGVRMQDTFFNSSQQKMLEFLNSCVFGKTST